MIENQEWIPFDSRNQYPNKNVFYNTECNDLSMKIYRYIDTAYLDELLSGKLFVKNRLNSPDVFEHEDYALHKKQPRFKINIDLKSRKSRRLLQTEKEDYRICISSWTDESQLNSNTDENIFSWGYYSKELPQGYYLCRIETTLEDLILSIKENHLAIWIGRAIYNNSSSTWFLNNRIFVRPQEYQIENEIRMCIQHVSDDNYYLEVDPSILVKGIRISPYMPKEEAESLRQRICNTYKFMKLHQIRTSKIQLLH